MDIQPQFPPARRRDDPQRNSEAEVDELIAAPEAPELDFCIWLEGRAGSASRSRAAGTPWTGASGPSRPSTGRKTCPAL